jgi:hypothetical protein
MIAKVRLFSISSLKSAKIFPPVSTLSTAFYFIPVHAFCQEMPERLKKQ